MRQLAGRSCLVVWVSIGLCAGQSSAGKSSAQKKTAAPAKSKTASKSGTAGKTTAPDKNSSAKSGSASGSKAGTATKARSKTAAKTPSKTSAAKRKKAAPKVTWRNRQLSPAPDRYKEIQDALAAKGYLNAEDANGQWGQSSAAALKSFQAAQNIESNGKIDSLSLIALGLGPKRETPLATKPPEPETPKPPVTPPAP